MSTEVITQDQPQNGIQTPTPVIIGGHDIDSSEARKLLINTVAKNASNEEFAMFREMCRATGLNPFQRQIWFIKTNSGVQMMTGINGYYHVANSYPEYDGIEVETVEDKAGGPLKSVAKVWRKDRKHPSIGIARWEEFSKSYGNWKSMPFYMLEKCAEAIALRKAFPQKLSGIYTEEEMPHEFSLKAASGKPSSEQTERLEASHKVSMWNPDNIEGTYHHCIVKLGRTHKGLMIGDKQCHLEFLRNHLNSYREEYTMEEQEAFALRIEELERAYAKACQESESLETGKTRPVVKDTVDPELEAAAAAAVADIAGKEGE